MEVAGDAVGEWLDEAAVDGFAGIGEEVMKFFDGLGAALFGGVEFAGRLATGERVAEIGLGIAAAVEGEEGAGSDAAVFSFAAAGFLLGDGALETFEIGGESFRGKFGEGFARGCQLAASLLFDFAGLDQGGLAGSGIAVGFFENLDAGFEIAQGLPGAGDLLAVALQGIGCLFQTGTVLFGAAAVGGFGSLGLAEFFL